MNAIWLAVSQKFCELGLKFFKIHLSNLEYESRTEIFVINYQKIL